MHLEHSWRGLPFTDVFILDRRACQWVYQDFNGGRLTLTIQPSTDRVNTVRVQAQSRGALKFQQGGIRAIKLPHPPSEPEPNRVEKDPAPGPSALELEKTFEGVVQSLKENETDQE